MANIMLNMICNALRIIYDYNVQELCIFFKVLSIRATTRISSDLHIDILKKLRAIFLAGKYNAAMLKILF